ncbi:MAG: transcription elongation factor GreA [Candidatus Spechtbacterales bacterium]|nr:transcription elongation factor GreA [Candidatus Spechtbacterales bacterium]
MEEYFTQKGLKQMKAELEKLKTEKKWEIAKWLKEAATQGDMDENAEYLAAKEAQTALENRIEELEHKIRNAKVIKRRNKDIVEIGAKVEYATQSNKKSKIMLVSSEEADAGEGKISVTSPMGKAMLGKKKGENIEVHTPKGKKRYRITKIA